MTASSNVFILKSGQQQGPYELSQIQAMWRQGTVTSDTLFWRQGMTEWQPLSTIADELGPLPPAAPVPQRDHSVPRQPQPWPNRQQTASLIIFVLISLGLWWFLNHPMSTPSSSSSSSSTMSSSSPSSYASSSSSLDDSYWFTGEADTLYREYDANEVAADGKYKGKLAMVSGTVKNISKDFLGSPYVIVGGSGFLDGVQCMFPRSDTSIASLSKGDSVTIRGRVKGKRGNVLLDDCALR